MALDVGDALVARVRNDRGLVAYGSTLRRTEIAHAIWTTLRAAGLEVDVERGRDVRSLEPYRAMVVSSAVHMAHSRRAARRLLRGIESSGTGRRG